MSLWIWTELTAAVHVADQTGPEIRGVSIDSRTVAEGDLAVFEALEPAVGNGDAVQVACDVVQDLLPVAGVLSVNDPTLAPDEIGRAHV